MIADTSALIAVLLAESGYDLIMTAIASEPARVPAPIRLEFVRVARGRLNLDPQAEALLEEWDDSGVETIAFDRHHAAIAARANSDYGTGNGKGGKLNMLDLMAYAVAIERNEPLLFTGRDFTTTDVLVHPASRIS